MSRRSITPEAKAAGLSDRRLSFAQAYAGNGGNGAQAWLATSPTKITYNAAKVSASRALTDANVQQAVEHAFLKARTDERIQIAKSNEDILRDLATVTVMAASDKQYGPAVRAIELQGRARGMFALRTEMEVRHTADESLLNAISQGNPALRDALRATLDAEEADWEEISD